MFTGINTLTLSTPSTTWSTSGRHIRGISRRERVNSRNRTIYSLDLTNMYHA